MKSDYRLNLGIHEDSVPETSVDADFYIKQNLLKDKHLFRQQFFFKPDH